MEALHTLRGSTMMTGNQHAFVVESNRIEGINGATQADYDAHERFWARDTITGVDLERFVGEVAGARIRGRVGLNVRVGSHRPPPGGPGILIELARLLQGANTLFDRRSIYLTHIAYETLHPFMDGNGRSGRTLWAWAITRGGQNPFPLGFLHNWYYDSLMMARR